MTIVDARIILGGQKNAVTKINKNKKNALAKQNHFVKA